MTRVLIFLVFSDPRDIEFAIFIHYPSLSLILSKMLGVFRQFGVSQALRASAPRTLSARSAQLCKWQAPATRTPVLARSFQTSFPAFNAATQATQAAKETESEPELITKFADLQKHELIDGTLIRNIVSPVRMGLETMTEVQSQTINQMLQGDDV